MVGIHILIIAPKKNHIIIIKVFYYALIQRVVHAKCNF